MNRSQSLFFKTLAALTVVGLASSHAKAQALAFTTTGNISNVFNGSSSILGLNLTFSSTVTVTDIGTWVGSFSAAAGQTAGIYDQSGTLLASATLTAGTATHSAFRMTTLSSPLVLSAGTYRVAAFYRSGIDRLVVGPVITAAGGVTMGLRYRQITGSLIFPTTQTASQFYAPNVLFQPGSLSAAAPEPGTLALLALGGTLVIVRRRRK